MVLRSFILFALALLFSATPVLAQRAPGGDPEGACCYYDGTYHCMITTEFYCDDTLGGVWYAGTACDTVTCSTGVIKGACCLTSGVCELKTSSSACTTLGGVFHGLGISCVGIVCATPTGACCHTNGLCDTRSSASCSAVGGIYLGNSTTCDGCEAATVLGPEIGITGQWSATDRASFAASVEIVCTYYQPVKFTWQACSNCTTGAQGGFWIPAADGAPLVGAAATAIGPRFRGDFTPETRHFGTWGGSGGFGSSPWLCDLDGASVNPGATGSDTCAFAYLGSSAGWRMFLDPTNHPSTGIPAIPSMSYWFHVGPWWDSFSSNCRRACPSGSGSVFRSFSAYGSPRVQLVDTREDGNGFVEFYSHFDNFAWQAPISWVPFNAGAGTVNYQMERAGTLTGTPIKLYRFELRPYSSSSSVDPTTNALLTEIRDLLSPEPSFSWKEIDLPEHMEESELRTDLTAAKTKIVGISGDGGALGLMRLPTGLMIGASAYDPLHDPHIIPGGAVAPMWSFTVDMGAMLNAFGSGHGTAEPITFVANFTPFAPYRIIFHAFILGFLFLTQLGRVWGELRKV